MATMGKETPAGMATPIEITQGHAAKQDAVHTASVSIPASLTTSAGTYLRTMPPDLKTMLCANPSPTLNPAEGAWGKRLPSSGNQEKSI